MDIKAYISSGIIEQFVLGLTSEEENREVLRMKELYPEVAKAIMDYEISMEQYSTFYAVAPSGKRKEEIMKAIHKEAATKKGLISPAPPHTTKKVRVARSMKRWRRFAIASIILLAISTAINIYVIPKYKKYKDNYTLLIANQEHIIAKNRVIKTQLVRMKSNLNILTDPHLKPILLNGVNHHKEVTATVLWNIENGQTYLSKADLPQPPPGMAYQLWGIVDGKPVSLGMYTPQKEVYIKKMDIVSKGKVDAFAITLEKEEGSKTPTLSQMFVLGKAS